jgi:uncharacterized protein (DUF58 family)
VESGPARPRVRPTPEGQFALWFTTGFSVVAVAVGDNLVFLLGCLLVGTLLAAAFLARRNLAGLSVERTVAARGRAGIPLPLRYAVRRASGRMSVGVRVVDRLPPSARPLVLEVECGAVAEGAAAEAEGQAIFLRRGRHRFEPVTLESRYPLGVWKASCVTGGTDDVRVRPREGRPTAALLARLGGKRDDRARRIQAARGEDALFGVREFREGDDPRRIHWKSTARRGATIVSEWRAETGREIVVVLGRSVGPGLASARVFERAVSVVATVWRAAVARAPARLLTGERGRDGGGGNRRLAAGLDRLAVVRGQAGRRPRAALESLGPGATPRCVVFVACGPEPGLGRVLARAAGPGGDAFVLRADEPGIARWVRGLA